MNYKDKINCLLGTIANPKKNKDAAFYIEYGNYSYDKKKISPFDYIMDSFKYIIKYAFYRKATYPKYINEDIFNDEILKKEYYKIGILTDILYEAVNAVCKLNNLCSNLGIDIIADINEAGGSLQKIDSIICGIADEYIGGVKYDY